MKIKTLPFTNQKGQMSFFIIFIFQMIFILFAMSINVALIVHDKINLQNTADLAAYYAASKQAEMLTAIAHQNYQIRQAWKLLAFRVNVLGTSGLGTASTDRGNTSLVHPVNQTARNPNLGNLEPRLYGFGSSPAQHRPVVCTLTPFVWQETASRDRTAYCTNPDFSYPDPVPISRLLRGNPLVGGVLTAINEAIERGLTALRDKCDLLSWENWWMSQAFLASFRLDQANRKEVISALAKNLSQNDFKDIRGGLVKEGVFKVVYKNLTHANRTNLRISLLNSLALGCEDPTSCYTKWLSEIPIATTFWYGDFRPSGSASCAGAAKYYYQRPSVQTNAANYLGVRQGSFLEGLNLNPNAEKAYLQRSAEKERALVLSLGYEKNPWHMAYVGVQVRTSSYQIFHPFGKTVELTATAYAKPFGGRVGPWYRAQWEKGASESSGRLVDAVAPLRISQASLATAQNPIPTAPNVARFPGDTKGYRGFLALGAYPQLAAMATKPEYYLGIVDIGSSGSKGDVLVWDRANDKSPGNGVIRDIEVASVSPNLFDTIYYSIEPNYWENYGQHISLNKETLGIPVATEVRPDIGGRLGTPRLREIRG